MPLTKEDRCQQGPIEFHELLMRLKCTAVYSSNPKLLWKSRRQILTARRVLVESNPDIPWNKRKRCNTAACSLPPRKQKKTKSTRSNQMHKCPPLSAQDIISHADPFKSSTQILSLSPSHSSSELSESCSSFSRKTVPQNITEGDDLESTTSSDDSTNCNYGLSTDNSLLQTQEQIVRQVSIQNTTDRNNSSISIDKTPVDCSEFLSPNKELCGRSNRLNSFIGDQLQENVIPIGEHFQANMPQWTGVASDEYKFDTSKWLGQKIWPIENAKSDIGKKLIGNGRQNSLCSCTYPDSADCIRLHVCEERTRLQSEIGDAFYSWGIDSMGESVCTKWMPSEQNDFNSLFKRKTTMYNKSFWKRVSKVFPLKPRKSIISYYFNVFVLRNMRTQVCTRSPVIDSDDDEIPIVALSEPGSPAMQIDQGYDDDITRDENFVTSLENCNDDDDKHDPVITCAVIPEDSGKVQLRESNEQPGNGIDMEVLSQPPNEGPAVEDVDLVKQSILFPIFVQIAEFVAQLENKNTLLKGQLKAANEECARVQELYRASEEGLQQLHAGRLEEKTATDEKIRQLKLNLRRSTGEAAIYKKMSEDAIALLKSHENFDDEDA